MKKLLIVTYFFPPMNEIASRRFLGIIEELMAHGWSVFVLTTDGVGTLNHPIPGLTVIRIGSHPARVAGKPAKESLAMGLIRRLRRSMKVQSRYIDRAMFSWYLPAAFSGKLHLKGGQKFDVVIGSYGPGASLFIARSISKKQAIPLVLDIRDLGALRDNDGFCRNHLVKWLDKTIETFIMRDAAAVVTVSETLNNILAKAYNKYVYTVYNGWHVRQHSFEKRAPDNKGQLQVLYYAGRMYPHQLQALSNLLEAIRGTQWRLKMHCIGTSILTVDQLRVYVSDKVPSGQVEILPEVSAQQAANEQESADVNVVFESLEENNEWGKGTITGKLMPLLTMEAPVLAIARKDSEIGKILDKSSKGKLCSTVMEIARFLQVYHNGMYPTDSKKIEAYSKRVQGQILVDILDLMVSK